MCNRASITIQNILNDNGLGTKIDRWLALGAGIAGGADVVLIPEIPYSLDSVAEAIKQRAREGKRFSIVAVAEGAMTVEQAARVESLSQRQDNADSKADKAKFKQYAPGQNCTNCALYQGGTAAQGGCALFPGKDVLGAGWCSAYAKKA